jgi:outer membrane protein insertion porin family
LGRAGAVQYNWSFLDAGSDFFSSEGVDILPVKPNLMANYGSHKYFRTPNGSSPVKTMSISISHTLRTAMRGAVVNCVAGVLLLLAMALSGGALAQQSQTIDQIRVVGNRRIPKETILARLFTHVGEQFDPISIERDFNSLWNTAYFEDLRIEREDSEKGVILNIFVREKPTIREINYKGQQFHLNVRRAGPVQEGKGRVLGGKPV